MVKHLLLTVMTMKLKMELVKETTPYVLDIATAHIAPPNYLFDGGAGGIFNVGGGHSSSIKEVIAEVEKQLDLTIDTEVGPQKRR